MNQTNRMPLHILLVATGLSGQPIAEQAAPRESPGLSAPERKARSQKQVVCPRKLREPSCLSLRASRLAAACRLRQSCRRDRGPVTLPRSGCHVCRSRHPAALPPPWAFRPRGGGPVASCCGARLARGGAPAREGWGFSPYPISARAISAAASPRRTVSSTSNRHSAYHPCFPEDPVGRYCALPTCGLRRLARNWGRRYSAPRKGSPLNTCSPPERVPGAGPQGECRFAPQSDTPRIRSPCPAPL